MSESIFGPLNLFIFGYVKGGHTRASLARVVFSFKTFFDPSYRPPTIVFFLPPPPPFLAKTEGGENGVASFFSKQSGVAKKGVAIFF